MEIVLSVPLAIMAITSAVVTATYANQIAPLVHPILNALLALLVPFYKQTEDAK
jgi:hypothetical protein